MLFSQPLLRIHLILLSLHATLSPACESLRPRRMNDSFSSTRPRVPSEGLNEILHPSPNSSSAADRKDNEPNQKDPLCERGPVFFWVGFFLNFYGFEAADSAYGPKSCIFLHCKWPFPRVFADLLTRLPAKLSERQLEAQNWQWFSHNESLFVPFKKGDED